MYTYTDTFLYVILYAVIFNVNINVVRCFRRTIIYYKTVSLFWGSVLLQTAAIILSSNIFSNLKNHQVVLRN